ncbi:Putative FBD-associated F-box protein [Frankliniella fusca]|uniref:FBD-associated F-box protein n=1 Tax=Frankliniella fusca TaxID=407009 RepID=A0AAE1H4B6_9NEOP|nr:Putative FBD-associated F-box protein [Frankliniella fusca]
MKDYLQFYNQLKRFLAKSVDVPYAICPLHPSVVYGIVIGVESESIRLPGILEKRKKHLWQSQKFYEVTKPNYLQLNIQLKSAEYPDLQSLKSLSDH